MSALFQAAICAALVACGGGSGGPGAGSEGGSAAPPPGGGGTPPPAPTPSAPPVTLSLTPCQPGSGTDYQVGDGKPYTALEQVPWEGLGPGDTVRIFHRATPYKGKFLIAAQGTASAPVRVCGVRGPNNERPVIDGSGAVTRRALSNAYGNTAFTSDIHQGRSIIVVKPLATQAYEAYPRYIQIDGLNLVRAHPNYTFTDASGASKRYDEFGACIWVDRGHNVLIADNEISDCSMAVFSKSVDDGAFAITKNLRIAGNYMWGNGIAGSDRMHTTYTQSVGMVIEFNRYGPLRAGAGGNSAKDRSVGTVVRYNRIEEGARAVDLVEAEDFPVYALSDPAYRSTFVYGNQIRKNGDTGSVIHYGGDHYGSSAGAPWGEPIFRKGVLYFFNNTLHITGNTAELFQVDTTEERAEIWNNIFVFDGVRDGYRSMRAQREVGVGWTPGGIVNLGRNWISAGWRDSDEYHPIQGPALNGVSNLIVGTTPPIDLATMQPLAGSAVIDSDWSPPAAASGYVVGYQMGAGFVPMVRSVNGAAIDMGAVER